MRDIVTDEQRRRTLSWVYLQLVIIKRLVPAARFIVAPSHRQGEGIRQGVANPAHSYAAPWAPSTTRQIWTSGWMVVAA